MFIKPVIAYPVLILTAIAGYAIGGASSVDTITNNALKMCNQKPLECKFKYDILMYNETGRVPYSQPKPQTEVNQNKK
jgi:hypothetical protein